MAERAILAQWGDDGPGPHNGEVGRRLVEQVLEVVKRQHEVASVIDLGCGNGYLAHRLGQLGHRVLGIDGSDRLLAIAGQHYAADRVAFEHALFGEPLPPAVAARATPGFDLAVSVDVIEHVYRPASLLETADLVLKPGGRLIVCTPYHGYLKNVAISVLNRWDSHHHVHFDGGHIKFFSVASLSAMLRRRFEVEHVEYYGRFPGFWKNMIVVARKRAV